MKSPFLVYEEFISPLQCEEVISNNNAIFPNYDKDGNVLPVYSGNKLAEMRIAPKIFEEIVPDIENHYGVDVKGIKSFLIEWYATNFNGSPQPRCENSLYINGKWGRCNDHDFTGVIFLNDYQDSTPFDSDFEVYGGKLEFPTHEFSFNPQRGRLVIFPGAPNFINATSKISAGELTQIRFHIATHDLFVYNMNEFPGNYKTWFKKGENQ